MANDKSPNTYDKSGNAWNILMLWTKSFLSNKRYGMIEQVALLMQIAVLTAAIVEESTPLHNIFEDHNIIIESELSLVILQIMATIGTLTIALLALLSSALNERYAGIMVSDYLLNIRPCIFKQKYVTIFSVILVALGVILHMVGYYAVVLGLYICETILVILSIISVYTIFYGKNEYTKEIREYIIDGMTTQKIRSENKEKFRINFCEDIKNADICNLNYQKEIYIDLLRNDIKFLLEQKSNSEGNTKFKDDGEIISYIFDAGRISGNNKIKLFVLTILQSSYDVIYQELMQAECTTDLSPLKNYKAIDYRNYRVLLQDIIYSLKPEEIENSDFVVSKLINEMLAVGCVSTGETDVETICGDLLEGIAYYLNRALRKAEQFRSDYWFKIFEGLIYTYEPIPDKYVNDFKRYKLELCLKYAYSLIFLGMFNDLRKCVLEPYHIFFNGRDKHRTQFIVFLHAYLYYIYKEDPIFLNAEYKEKCKRELYETDIYQTILHNVISNVSYEDITIILNEEIIAYYMRKYDARMQKSGIHILIQEDIIHDFCVFLQLYICKNHHRCSLSNIDVNDILSYFIDDSRIEKTKRQLEDFVVFMKPGDNRENHKQLSNSMFAKLHGYVVEKFKLQEMEKARKAEIDFKKKGKIVLEKKIEQQISKYIRERLERFITSLEEKNEIIVDITPFSFQTYTEDVNENVLETFQENIIGQIYTQFILTLLNNGLLKEFTRKYNDDDQYLNELKSYEFKLFSGSEYLYRNRDWKLSETFRNITKDSEFIPVDATNIASVTLAGFAYFRVVDINVDIIPVGLEAAANIDNLKYQYCPINDFKIIYSKDELNEYLGNRKKNITVSVKIAVQPQMNFGGAVIREDTYNNP